MPHPDYSPLPDYFERKYRDSIEAEVLRREKAFYKLTATDNAIWVKWRSKLMPPDRCSLIEAYQIIRPPSVSAWNEQLEEARTELDDAREAKERALRIEATLLYIPKEFQTEIDRAKLKNPRAHDEVVGHRTKLVGEDGSGLLCLGASGQGKTRAVYTLLFEYGKRMPFDSFKAVTALELKQQVQTLCRKPAALAEYIESFFDAETIIHFIDDISTASLTQAYAETLHHLIDGQTSRGLPVIVTSQLGREALLEKLGGYQGKFAGEAGAILRRLGDYCHGVNFDR